MILLNSKIQRRLLLYFLFPPINAILGIILKNLTWDFLNKVALYLTVMKMDLNILSEYFFPFIFLSSFNRLMQKKIK